MLLAYSPVFVFLSYASTTVTHLLFLHTSMAGELEIKWQCENLVPQILVLTSWLFFLHALLLTRKFPGLDRELYCVLSISRLQKRIFYLFFFPEEGFLNQFQNTCKNVREGPINYFNSTSKACESALG